MHNRRDRLSADMKGTIAIGGDADNESSQTIEHVEEKEKKNDFSNNDNITSTSNDKVNIQQRGNNEDNENIDANSYQSETVDDQERLKLDWRIGEWSRCSQTCGPEGKQVNAVD